MIIYSIYNKLVQEQRLDSDNPPINFVFERELIQLTEHSIRKLWQFGMDAIMMIIVDLGCVLEGDYFYFLKFIFDISI